MTTKGKGQSAKKAGAGNTPMVPLVNGKKKFLLSDGREVEIREGTGRDAEEAQATFGGDSKKYMSALMAQCIIIDGNKIVMEDLPLLPLKDYMKIQTEFSEINF